MSRTLKLNDTPTLTATLTKDRTGEDETPVDLEEATVLTYIRHEESQQVVAGGDEAVIEAPKDGEVSYQLDPSQTALEGVYEVEFVAEWYDDQGDLERRKTWPFDGWEEIEVIDAINRDADASNARIDLTYDRLDVGVVTNRTTLDRDYHIQEGQAAVLGGPIEGSGELTGDGDIIVLDESIQDAIVDELSRDLDANGHDISNIGAASLDEAFAETVPDDENAIPNTQWVEDNAGGGGGEWEWEETFVDDDSSTDLNIVADDIPTFDRYKLELELFRTGGFEDVVMQFNDANENGDYEYLQLSTSIRSNGSDPYFEIANGWSVDESDAAEWTLAAHDNEITLFGMSFVGGYDRRSLVKGVFKKAESLDKIRVFCETPAEGVGKIRLKGKGL